MHFSQSVCFCPLLLENFALHRKKVYGCPWAYSVSSESQSNCLNFVRHKPISSSLLNFKLYPWSDWPSNRRKTTNFLHWSNICSTVVTFVISFNSFTCLAFYIFLSRLILWNSGLGTKRRISKASGKVFFSNLAQNYLIWLFCFKICPILMGIDNIWYILGMFQCSTNFKVCVKGLFDFALVLLFDHFLKWVALHIWGTWGSEKILSSLSQTALTFPLPRYGKYISG